MIQPGRVALRLARQCREHRPALHIARHPGVVVADCALGTVHAQAQKHAGIEAAVSASMEVQAEGLPPGNNMILKCVLPGAREKGVHVPEGRGPLPHQNRHCSHRITRPLRVRLHHAKPAQS